MEEYMKQQRSEIIKTYLRDGNTMELQAVLDTGRVGINDFTIVDAGLNPKTMLIYAV